MDHSHAHPMQSGLQLGHLGKRAREVDHQTPPPFAGRIPLTPLCHARSLLGHLARQQSDNVWQMQQHVALSWSDELLTYDFGAGHPMSPKRLELTMELARELGLFDDDCCEVCKNPPASDELLATVHEPEYLAAVAAASTDGVPDLARGLGTDDNPIFPGMYDAAARIVGGTVSLAESVWDGEVAHGVNLAGGMHHAMPGSASGFCIFNDAAVAIKRLQALGAKKIVYLDLDAHHGDGVEKVFWNDPSVLTISIHQDGRTAFPGTGAPDDIGGPDALGMTVNLPLPPRTDSSEWLRAYDAVVPPLLRAFQPDFIVSQHGCDAHRRDPLSDLRVGVHAQCAAAAWTHQLAHEVCDGRWLALGGGGYSVVDVVPVMWSALLAEALHHPLDWHTPLPMAWREQVAQESGRENLPIKVVECTWQPWPTSEGEPSTDSASSASADPPGLIASAYQIAPSQTGAVDPANAVDQAILATRRAVFGYHGLVA